MAAAPTNPPRRLVLLGSDEIALPAFRAVAALADVVIVAVYSQPDRPAGRGQEIQPNPVTAWARAAGHVVRQPERLGSEHAAELAAEGIDLGVVMAYGQILKEDFLSAPRLGLVNFHGSPLPALRGATPVEGALAAGWTTTGVSLQQVVRRLDAGPVHASATLAILPDEGRAALRARLGELAGRLAAQAIPAILAGRSVPRPQDEAAATFTRRLTRGDAALDFRAPAPTLAARIRALEGWPGSTIEHAGVVLKVGAAAAEAGGGGVPGTVLSADRGGVRIACGEGVLVLSRLQRPGGRMLPAGEFLSGHPLTPGEVLTSVAMPTLVGAVPFPRPPKA
ncbi:MAG: methionyl-tRNA formyltransferase [Opitutia bacterium]